MKRSFAWLLIFLSLQVSPVGAAEFRLMPDFAGTGNLIIALEGPIKAGDFEKFKVVLDGQNSKNIVVSAIILNSPGGAVVPALAIGRYIRQKRLVTYSPVSCGDNECICASACALIWFGGISRTGTVFVHRPSLRDEDQRLDFDAWDSAVNEAQNDIQSYLNEMRISDSVSDAMLSTNPNDIAPIQAGKDVAYKDTILEDFSRTRCGSPMSEFQKFYLASFEGGGEQSDESGLKDVAREFLSVLREKSSWLKECNKRVLYTVQEEAQFAR